jgi:hypothetical protein
MIAKALRIHKADGLGKPDYALFSAGARIIEEQTSPTFRGTCNTMFSWILGSAFCTGKQPKLALTVTRKLGLICIVDSFDSLIYILEIVGLLPEIEGS